MAFFEKKTDIPPAVVPPATEPVSRAEFTAMTESIRQMAEAVTQSVNRPVVVQREAAAVIVEPEVSDEELDAAIAEGKGGAEKIKRLLKRTIDTAKAEVGREVASIRDYGSTVFSNIAERVATQTMDQDIFKRFEKEIREAVGQCDAPVRGLPETWQSAYELVVGRHYKELTAEQSEATLRQKAAEEDAARSAAVPGKGGRQVTSPDDEIPTIQDFIGGQGSWDDGLTEDEFIRKINKGRPAGDRYKDWGDYQRRDAAVRKSLRNLRDGLDDGHEGRSPLPADLQ